MQTLKDLARKMKNLKKDVPEQAVYVVQGVVAKLSYSLIHTTPVDTSQALSNWRVGLNLAPLGNVKAHREGQYGSTRSVSQSIAYTLALQSIQRYRSGKILYIVNNLDYIEALEQGKSYQRKHFVKTSLEEARTYANQIIKTIRWNV